ncbi:MAG: hypothetical protein PHO07_07750, partial [Pirellulales bacterium]|nr:hypothetical protein [Pirellulales bacterium]
YWLTSAAAVLAAGRLKRAGRRCFDRTVPGRGQGGAGRLLDRRIPLKRLRPSEIRRPGHWQG